MTSEASKQPKAGTKTKPSKAPAEIPDATRCFVYMTLPGETLAVAAGRYDLTQRAGTPLGQFVYGKSYLARKNAVEIDPIELKLAARRYETTLLKGVFGALRDAGPDAWGRIIIDRYHNRALNELGYLMNSADDRAGALGFGTGEAPPAPRKKFNQTLQLEELQRIAADILKEKRPKLPEQAAQINKLLLISTLMGGARPKAVVEDNDGLWVAKFGRPQDRWNDAKVEHAMLLLARACGISVAENKVVLVAKRDVLLVKRFDRERVEKGVYYRHRMVSGLTLLRADEMDPRGWSYVTLAEQLRRVSSDPRKDAAELFRRMTFNALISNIDDHPRNHALVAKDKWRLSPAYDVTPQNPVGIDRRNLAMICGRAGTYANIHNLLSECRRFLLKPEEAEAIIREMMNLVKNSWWSTARKVGVAVGDCEKISGAFVYPGFSYELTVA